MKQHSSVLDFETNPREIDEKILIVVGDVHGDIDQLMIPYQLYTHCKNAKLIYIGDYCSTSPENELVYNQIVKTIDDPNIIYLRGNHESRNFDRNEMYYKYKVLKFRNAYAVDSNLDEVNELDKAKYLFTHAEFTPFKENEFKTVSEINEIPVESANDFIYRYEKADPDNKIKNSFQNIFGHHHCYDLTDETMNLFMNNEIRRLCIDIDSSYVFHYGSTSVVCFLILKKDSYEIYKKTIRHDPKKIVPRKK